MLGKQSRWSLRFQERAWGSRGLWVVGQAPGIVLFWESGDLLLGEAREDPSQPPKPPVAQILLRVGPLSGAGP